MGGEGDWLTASAAAELAGVSLHVVRAELAGGGLPGRRLGRRWLVARADVEEWVAGRRVPVRDRLRRDRYGSADRRPYVELLEAVGLGDEEVAARLGVSAGRVARWRLVGVPNLYVARLRALAGGDGP